LVSTRSTLFSLPLAVAVDGTKQVPSYFRITKPQLAPVAASLPLF